MADRQLQGLRRAAAVALAVVLPGTMLAQATPTRSMETISLVWSLHPRVGGAI